MGRKRFIVLAAGLMLVGCSPQEQAEVQNTVQNAAATVQKEAKPLLDKTGKAVTDASITARVKAAMTASTKLDSSDINVDTKNKVVYLKGTVPDAAQKKLADSIASNTLGSGESMVSQLQVRRPARGAAPQAAPGAAKPGAAKK